MDICQRKHFSGKVVLGKARVSEELIFGNRIRTTQDLIECIRVREDGSGKREAKLDGNEKEGLYTLAEIVDYAWEGCLKMKYSIYGTVCHLSNKQSIPVTSDI